MLYEEFSQLGFGHQDGFSTEDPLFGKMNPQKPQSFSQQNYL